MIDYVPVLFPISCKGVVIRGDKVLLLLNERDEWELPGGKLERDETPEACVAREIEEETGLAVETGPLLDVWVYRIATNTTMVSERRDVLIVTYGMYCSSSADAALSHEHKEVGLFTGDEVSDLNMPDGYKRSVAGWFGRLRGT